MSFSLDMGKAEGESGYYLADILLVITWRDTGFQAWPVKRVK